MRSGGDTIQLSIRRAPLVPLASWLEEKQGDVTLWSAPGEEWSFIGFGVAAQIIASGPSRFDDIQRQAQALFSRVKLQGEPLPTPVRLFGGASFQDSAHLSEPWSDFHSADFILPAWCYLRNQESAFIWEASGAFAPEKISTQPPATNEDHASAPRPRSEELQSWSALVNAALDEMRQRRFEKVVLSRCSKIEHSKEPSLSQSIELLQSRYTSCARFVMGRRGSLFIGATPERLVSLREQRVKIDALAGSSPDIKSEVALLQNEKERREHQHVIDGIKEALPGLSFAHPEAPQIKALPNVLHLYTPMEATLSTPMHVLSLVDSLHPTPAVCGSPKEPARRWLSEHEPHPRGWYAGPVGHFDANGEGAFFVALRSALLQDRTSFIYSGAGLVLGSNPEREYEETEAKQRPMREALRLL